MEKVLDRFSSISTTDQALDFYSSLNLPEAIMTIIDIFD
jgi:hypothetical protein